MASFVGSTERVVSQIPVIGTMVPAAYSYDYCCQAYRVNRKLSEELKCLSQKISTLRSQIGFLQKELKKDQTSLLEIRSFKQIFERNQADFSRSLGQYLLKRGNFSSFLPSSLTEEGLLSLPGEAVSRLIDDEEKKLQKNIEDIKMTVDSLEKQCKQVDDEKSEKENQANLEKKDREGILFQKMNELNRDVLLPNGAVPIASAVGLAVVLGPLSPALPAVVFCSALQTFANATIEPIIEKGAREADALDQERAEFDEKLVAQLKEEPNDEDDWVILTQGIQEAESVKF